MSKRQSGAEERKKELSLADSDANFDVSPNGDAESDSLEGRLYPIKLKDFDGPFDVLCHLIKKSKYSLEDVKISDITEQYLQYIKQIDQLDLDKASEFITMAAWLLEIKSKALLPKPIFEQEEAEDPERLLKQQLAEYALYKEASQKMREKETVGIHFREPDSSVLNPRFEVKSMDLSGLMGALQRVFLKLGQKAEEIRERNIVKDRFTVEEKLAQIRDIIAEEETYNFFALFDDNYTKSEIITTFQALLELLKLQYITAEQSEIYGDIILKRALRHAKEDSVQE